MNRIALWPKTAPYSASAGDFQPSLEPYELPNAKIALLICPGGGYSGKAWDYEGQDIARHFNAYGLSGFVLDYRVAPCDRRAPLADAQRALRLIRWMGYQKIAILGFSAGGHLASSAAVHFDDGDPAAADPIERVSCRPDALAACYSVVTAGKYAHLSSIENLNGGPVGLAEVEKYSVELHVPDNAPPAFIWHTAADQMVPVQNALLLASAYAEKKLPFSLHVFPFGLHGIGLGAANLEARSWPTLLRDFLTDFGF